MPVPQIAIVEDMPFAEVVNAAGERQTLCLDLYLPAGGAAIPRPAILWFHGGAFRLGHDKHQGYIVHLARAFAARGYPGAVPDYRARAIPGEDPAEAVDDAVADGRLALEWVRAHACQYGFDAGRIILAGGSAGGTLALNLVHAASEPLPGIAAVLILWGTPAGLYRRFARVRRGSPATWIAHGTADKLTPYANSQAFIAELRRARVPHFLLSLPDAPHTPTMFLERIIASMEEFLREHIP